MLQGVIACCRKLQVLKETALISESLIFNLLSRMWDILLQGVIRCYKMLQDDTSIVNSFMGLKTNLFLLKKDWELGRFKLISQRICYNLDLAGNIKKI